MKLIFSSLVISLLLSSIISTTSCCSNSSVEEVKKETNSSSSPDQDYPPINCNETEHFNCDSSLGLVSDPNGECTCIRPSDMIFDINIRKCVLLVNASCGTNGEINLDVKISCTTDAECINPSKTNVKSNDNSTISSNVNSDKTDDDDEQQPSSLSPSGLCKCVEGFKEDKNRQCTNVKRDPPRCTGNGNGQCGAGMTCISNTCVCIDTNDMVYDEESQSCKSLVGTACFLAPVGGAEKNCVDNAECVPENNMVGYCKCRPGYDPDENKMCVGDGDGSNTTTVTTIRTTTTFMNSTEEEPTTPESTTPPGTTTANPGLGLIGEPCVVDKVISGYQTQDKEIHNDNKTDGGVSRFVVANNSKCIPNSRCNMGKCSCEKGYVAESAKKCIPSASGPTLTASVLLIVSCYQIVTYFI